MVKQDERPATTKVRCPKCRSRNLEIVENSWALQAWEVVDGKLDRAFGVMEPGGVDYCNANCRRCAHQWRLRGGSQITDFVEEAQS